MVRGEFDETTIVAGTKAKAMEAVLMRLWQADTMRLQHADTVRVAAIRDGEGSRSGSRSSRGSSITVSR